ncbi:helicase SRCAP-like, partial [Accipiter gentilis]|uniref:helicase SRCAP-like n=1 Tax=Astur gentilis TaxID=8957 RepID=UPI00210FD330
MQARLPSGEVVSIGQLAALAQRPGGTPGGATPGGGQAPHPAVTGQQTHPGRPPAAAPGPRPPPAASHGTWCIWWRLGGSTRSWAPPPRSPCWHPSPPRPPRGVPLPGPPPQPPTIGLPIATAQVPTPLVNSGGVVKIVVRQAPRDGLAAPPAPPPTPHPHPHHDPPRPPPARPLLR